MSVRVSTSWYDGIYRDERGDWFFTCLSKQHGSTHRSFVPASQIAGSDLLGLDNWSAMQADSFFTEIDISLASAQRVIAPRAVIRAAVPGLPISQRHALYRFTVGGDIYVVPALFFVDHLYLSARLDIRHLFEPGLLESYTDPSPSITHDSIVLRLPPNVLASRCTPEKAKLLAWLAMYPGAAKCWNSFSYFAAQGRIDLELPSFRMTARIGGLNVEGFRLVTWAKEVHFHRALPRRIVVRGRHGREKVFQRERTEMSLPTVRP